MYYLILEIPNAFKNGDGFGIRYVSECSKSKKEIRFQSCLDVLCYLTVCAPARVRLVPSCFRGGEDGVKAFQEKAVQFGKSAGFKDWSLTRHVPEMCQGQPLVATGDICNAQSPVPPSGERINSWESQAAGSTAWPTYANDLEVLGTLRGLHVGKVYNNTASSPMPDGIAMQLRALLPKDKGGLLSFLQTYPGLFEVTSLGQVHENYKGMFTFKVKKHWRSNTGSSSRWW